MFRVLSGLLRGCRLSCGPFGMVLRIPSFKGSIRDCLLRHGNLPGFLHFTLSLNLVSTEGFRLQLRGLEHVISS